MKFKTTVGFGLIISSVFFLSGCTFQGKSDGGVFKSFDGGASFEQRNKIGESGTLANASVLDLEIDPENPQVVYAGTQSLGILRSIDSGENWVRDVNDYVSVEDIVVNPGNSSEIYIAAVVGGIGKIMKTSNGGTDWKEVFTERTGDARVLSLVMDKNNAGILYAGDTLGGIYKTDDAGATWKTLLWAKSGVNKIELDNVNTSKAYFVTNSSGVLRTDDAGGNFTEIETSGTVYNLVAHPTRENVVFISDKNGLQRSDDGGTTLAQINTLVQPEKLGSRGLAVNPNNDSEIYFASGRAFYKTTNGGATWKPVQFDTSKTIEIIKMDQGNTSTLYIGTSNRSQSSGFSLFPTL